MLAVHCQVIDSSKTMLKSLKFSCFHFFCYYDGECTFEISCLKEEREEGENMCVILYVTSQTVVHCLCLGKEVQTEMWLLFLDCWHVVIDGMAVIKSSRNDQCVVICNKSIFDFNSYFIS